MNRMQKPWGKHNWMQNCRQHWAHTWHGAIYALSIKSGIFVN